MVLYSFPAFADTCTEKLPITIENLSGTFVSLDDPFTVHLTYKIDGTFSGYIEDKGTIVWRYEGIWKLEGNRQTSVYTYSSLARIPVGTKDEDEIISIGCDILTYGSSLSGKIKRYKKVVG
ncbi:MAG: hypothetical protein ACOZAR_03660 [Patescibacteria group bacterium]